MSGSALALERGPAVRKRDSGGQVSVISRAKSHLFCSGLPPAWNARKLWKTVLKLAPEIVLDFVSVPWDPRTDCNRGSGVLNCIRGGARLVGMRCLVNGESIVSFCRNRVQVRFMKSISISNSAGPRSRAIRSRRARSVRKRPRTLREAVCRPDYLCNLCSPWLGCAARSSRRLAYITFRPVYALYNEFVHCKTASTVSNQSF